MPTATDCPPGCSCRGNSRTFRLYLSRELLADNVPHDMVTVSPPGQACTVTYRGTTYGVNGVDRVSDQIMAVHLFGPIIT